MEGPPTLGFNQAYNAPPCGTLSSGSLRKSVTHSPTREASMFRMWLRWRLYCCMETIYCLMGSVLLYGFFISSDKDRRDVTRPEAGVMYCRENFSSLKNTEILLRIDFYLNTRWRIWGCFRLSPAADYDLLHALAEVWFLSAAYSSCDYVTFGILGSFQRVFKS